MTNTNNEIPVRRRDRGGVPWWAWVIAVVLLALLAWYLLSNMNKNNSGSGATSSPSASPAGSTDLSSPSGGASPAAGSPDASGSPAASWIGTPNLTVIFPARAGL